MRVGTVVPVEEADDVDLVADLERLDCFVGVAAGGAEIRFNAEVVGNALDRYLIVDIAAVFRLVSEGVTCVVIGFNRHTGENDVHILIVDKLVCAEQIGNVDRSREELCAVDYLDLGVGNFLFARPGSFETGHADFSSEFNCVVLFLSALPSVDEVRSVLILQVEAGVAVLSGVDLFVLNVGFDNDGGLVGRRGVFRVRHDLCFVDRRLLPLFGLGFLFAEGCAAFGRC